jgi:hypothetical protein
MIGFRLVNFLPPVASPDLTIRTPSGSWTLLRHGQFDDAREEIGKGGVGETYILEHPITISDGSAKVDAVFDEVTPILLGATYATGLSATVIRSTISSEVGIMTPSDRWPRPRGLVQPYYSVSNNAEFLSCMEVLVQTWLGQAQREKARLLIHHWIDALGCWSLEDLYLSATTLLQVISATEAGRQGNQINFFEGLSGAALRFGISAPSRDWVKMRNDLVHDGSLSATRYTGKSKLDCAGLACEVLNWIDLYMGTALGLRGSATPRFTRQDFFTLPAYSLD